MPVIQDGVFLHIHRASDPAWVPGARFFFGRSPNRFLQAFDTRQYVLQGSQSRRPYFVNDVAAHVLEVLRGERRPNEDLSAFYDDPVKVLAEANAALGHCLRFIRELVFEDVRIAAFPELPSRHRCIWLIPDDPKAVQYWWPMLTGANRKIFRVVATGKMHRTSQTYLELKTCSVNAWKEYAFRYWAGLKGRDSLEDEILFEGFIEVKEEVAPSSVGIG